MSRLPPIATRSIILLQQLQKLAPGAALLPVPQKVSLTNTRYLLDDSWSVVPASDLSKNHPALLSLSKELKDRFGLRLESTVRGVHSIQLSREYHYQTLLRLIIVLQRRKIKNRLSVISRFCF